MFAMYSGSFSEGMHAIIVLNVIRSAKVRLSEFYCLYWASSLISFIAIAYIVLIFLSVSCLPPPLPSHKFDNWGPPSLPKLLVDFSLALNFESFKVDKSYCPLDNFWDLNSFSPMPTSQRSLLESILILSTFKLVSRYKISRTIIWMCVLHS